MARKYNIKWRDSDKQKLETARLQFNRKIYNLRRKKVEGLVLPDPIKKGDLEEVIKTRSDFNRQLKSLERFTKNSNSTQTINVPNNDKLKMTKWQYREMRKMEKAELSRIKEQVERLANMPARDIRGRETGYSALQRQVYIGMGKEQENRTNLNKLIKGSNIENSGDLLEKLERFGMGSTEAIELEPTVAFPENLSPRELKAKYRTLRNRTQDLYFRQMDFKMRENYIQGLIVNYGDDADEIIERIRNMNIDDFIDRSYEVGIPSMFEIVSPPGSKAKSKTVEFIRDEDYQNNLDALYELWLE